MNPQPVVKYTVIDRLFASVVYLHLRNQSMKSTALLLVVHPQGDVVSELLCQSPAVTGSLAQITCLGTTCS